jgi:hypothetical protein
MKMEIRLGQNYIVSHTSERLLDMVVTLKGLKAICDRNEDLGAISRLNLTPAAAAYFEARFKMKYNRAR